MKKQPHEEKLPYSLRDRRQVAPDDTFSFACNPSVPCFTRCCADINILLTPLDVLYLARKIGISTTEFLDEYTLIPITKDLHLPVVLLKMGDDPEKRCHFLGDQGCTVYEARPWSCRMYPLGMALPPARAGVEPKPIYFLFEDEFCDGHKEPQTWTPTSWRENQGLMERESLEEEFRKLVSHPWFIGGRQLDPKRIEMFHMACYDLDRFRRFVFESTFLTRFELEDDLVETIRTDDEALYRFACRWLRFALFGEPTMSVRASAREAGRNR